MEQKKVKSQWEVAYDKKAVPVDLMVDFETFGSDPLTCGIMSVSLVRFCELDEAGLADVQMQVAVSMESNYERGLDMSSSQRWWNNPQRVAAWAWYANAEKVEFDEMVGMLAAFFNDFYQQGTELCIWSRGDFDKIILNRIMPQDAEFMPPFYAWRDARTFIRSLHISEAALFRGGHGTLHRPADDCLHCIRCIQTVCRTLCDLGFYNLPQIDAVTDKENRVRMKSKGL